MTRDDFLQNLISQFIHRRKALGLTQDDVEYQIGVADGSVSKWECGYRTPTAFNLFCWAEVLQSELTILYDDLMGGTNEE